MDIKWILKAGTKFSTETADGTFSEEKVLTEDTDAVCVVLAEGADTFSVFMVNGVRCFVRSEEI
jgi:hypothetical protein